MTPHEFVAWYRGYMDALDNACGSRKTAAVMTVALADIRRTAKSVQEPPGDTVHHTLPFIQVPTGEP